MVGGLYFQEQFSFMELVGMLLVLGAIAALNLSDRTGKDKTITNKST